MVLKNWVEYVRTCNVIDCMRANIVISAWKPFLCVCNLLCFCLFTSCQGGKICLYVHLIAVSKFRKFTCILAASQCSLYAHDAHCVKKCQFVDKKFLKSRGSKRLKIRNKNLNNESRVNSARWESGIYGFLIPV